MKMLLLATAGMFGLLIGGVSAIPTKATGEPISECAVTDGDTIRCGAERIRLLGIDAPEMPGHCRRGRRCAPGNPYAATANLQEALAAPLTIRRYGEDRYGRTLGMVSGARGELSCWQLRKKVVIYRSDWDNSLAVLRACPGAIW